MRTPFRCLGALALLLTTLAVAQEPDAGEPEITTAEQGVEETWTALAAEHAQRQSPGEVLASFLVAAHAGDFVLAAEALSLEHLPEAARRAEGPRLARRLMFLLDQHLSLDQLAPHELEAGVTVVGELPLRRLHVPVELVRQPADSKLPWIISARTVRSIDALYAEHGSPLWELLPQAVVTHSFWVLGAWQWLGFLLLLGLAGGTTRGLTAAFAPLLTRLARFTDSELDDRLVLGLRGPARTVLFLIAVVLGTRALAFPSAAQGLVDDLARAVVVGALVWAVLVSSRLVAEVLEKRSSVDRDPSAARAVKTQVSVLHRVVNAVVLVVGGALVLVQFPGVRHIGMSMLASAGVVGVVVGLAAQKSISNLLAGIQISLTQPIRIGDTVIVENEWGWIEEITLTYVVVKVWDLRRLVVPIGTFLEKPFQNWSRTSTEILGTVELFTDYRVDVGAVRAELSRVLEGERTKLWDGKVQGVQVTQLSERAMTVRVLVSAEDASKCWDLRCLVREQLVAWLKSQPDALPRVRTEGTGDAAAAARA